MRAVFFLCLLLVSVSRAAETTAVWIDTDPAIGSPWREVDDAYGLVLAFHSPEIRIVGISTTYGNASLNRTTAVARSLVRQFGRAAGITERGVFSGVAGPGDFQRKTEANEALAHALRKEKLIYVALGPLTNLADFAAQHPDLVSRIERVIFVGGQSTDRALAFGPHQFLKVHDANVFKDPEAARRILQTQIPLLLAPVETSSQLMLSPADFRQLHSAAGEFLRGESRVWLWFWTRLLGEKGGPLFDALPMIALTHPQWLQIETRFASVDQTEHLIAEPRRKIGMRRVRFCCGFESAALPFVRQRLSDR